MHRVVEALVALAIQQNNLVLTEVYQNVLTQVLITMAYADFVIMVNRGLGDTVSSIIRSVSRGKIKECGGCNKRKKWLNEKVPYNNTLLGMSNKAINKK